MAWVDLGGTVPGAVDWSGSKRVGDDKKGVPVGCRSDIRSASDTLLLLNNVAEAEKTSYGKSRLKLKISSGILPFLRAHKVALSCGD
jgi:hypothetical protein